MPKPQEEEETYTYKTVSRQQKMNPALLSEPRGQPTQSPLSRRKRPWSGVRPQSGSKGGVNGPEDERRTP